MCAEIQKGTQTLDRAGVLPALCPLWVKCELMELLHLMCAQARMQLALVMFSQFWRSLFLETNKQSGFEVEPSLLLTSNHTL